MQAQISLSIRQVHEFLLNVATARPVFIWGAPGIGKSSLVESFAGDLGMECVTLLGSQLAPEDLIGIPKIDGHVSRFYPPAMIVREREFVLFIDELNIASQEIQKAFYRLILDKRIGEHRLPAGSIIVGAGNRAQDAALARQMPSALVNRMVHVHLKASHREWLQWAETHDIHPWVLDYVRSRPSQLATDVPPAHEEPFSTPRSWHGVSDALHSFGEDIAADHLDSAAVRLADARSRRRLQGLPQADPQQVQRAQQRVNARRPRRRPRRTAAWSATRSRSAGRT